MTLAALTFTTPLMLLGAAFVALPIVAHLLNRRARQRVVFPTIALLKEAAAGQSRLFRMRRLLLLALRCLAVALIAWAFARPVWTEGGVAGSTGKRSAAVVLVLDVSASAAQRSGGVSLTTALRAQAERVLDELEAGHDVANIIYAGAQPRAAYPSLVPSLAALRAELSELRVTQERADLPAALSLAAQMLADRAGATRIVVLSDLQRTNWEEVQPLPPGDRRHAVTVIPLTGAAPGVSNVLARPRVFPSRPIVGRPAHFNVIVRNTADHGRAIDVTLTLNGRAAGSRREMLAAGEERAVSIEAALPVAGRHEAMFTTGPDDLDSDDRRAFTFEAVQRIPVALIADPAAGGAAYDSGFYLQRALAPAGDGRDALEVRTLTSGAVTEAALRGAEAVVIGDIGPLTPGAAETLRAYVAAGGGLAMFLGDGAVFANASLLDGNAAGDLLPWLPLIRRNLAARNEAAHITGGAWSLPPLAVFDEAAKDALAAIPVHRPYNATAPRDGTTTLLTFADGTPALSVRTLGSGGRVALANFSPAATSSDMGKHGVFVALTHGIVDMLRATPAGAAADHVVGLPIIHTMPPAGIEASTLAATGPDGKPRDIESIRDPDGLRVTIATVDQPGFYTLTAAGRPVATLAANIDERESDLRRIDLGELEQRLTPAGGAGRVDIRSPSDHEERLQLTGLPLWPPLLVAALATLALEMILLSLWKR